MYSIEIKEKGLISDDHLIKTENSWTKAKDLKKGDEIFNFKGKIVKIERIIECADRPDAPIVNETNKP